MKIGTIQQLWRFPVKSFKGEQLTESIFTPSGMLGDRAFALIEKESGKVVTARNVKQFPDLMDCKVKYIEEPEDNNSLPSLEISLPNGSKVSGTSSEIDPALSDYFNRDVTLADRAPANYTIEKYHPDLDKIYPEGFKDVSIEQKLGSALVNEIGLDSAIPVGSFMDMFPVSVITTSTLNQLHSVSPKSNFDVRRFRMNIVVDTPEDGFVENRWIKKVISIGKEVKLLVALPDPRCVMTTLAQHGIEKDSSILKTLAEHNRLDVAGGDFPCAGVYAVITSPGKIYLGDEVVLS